jgi:(p)ppGpp synthase/HD superfamily hydrolase
MSLLTTAIEFATERHKHQFRKDTKIPYLCHLFNVCKILAEKNCSEEVTIGGLLHDIVEDSDVSIEEVRERFGLGVWKLVRAATEPFKLQKIHENYDKRHTWFLRKLKTVSSLKDETTTDETLVILADKLDNIRSLRDDLRWVGEDVWLRFNADKERQHWYYKANVESLLERKDRHTFPLNALIAEFSKAVNEVFPEDIVYNFLEHHFSDCDDDDSWYDVLKKK